MTAMHVGTARPEVIEQGPMRMRTGPWRGDASIAYLAPMTDAALPSAAFVRHCLDHLARRGFTRVVTSALTPAEAGGFLDSGFEVAERLALLAYPVARLTRSAAITESGVRLRRARGSDWPGVLALDHVAFPWFWQVDGAGLNEAVAATPRARFRIAAARAGMQTEPVLAGYAILGRAGHHGYLQRLAVHPEHRRHHIGTALVLDGLHWLKRWHVGRVIVNTQVDNHGALVFYEHLGFEQQPLGLSVLAVQLSAA